MNDGTRDDSSRQHLRRPLSLIFLSFDLTLLQHSVQLFDYRDDPALRISIVRNDIKLRVTILR